MVHLKHHGVEETKRKLKTKYRFPGMDAEVEASVRCCNVCVAERNEQDLTQDDSKGGPSAPWVRVSLDLRRLPNGQLVAILVGSSSKFPVIETLRSTSFQDIRTALEKLFALVGTPKGGLPRTNSCCEDKHLKTILRP